MLSGVTQFVATFLLAALLQGPVQLTITVTDSTGGVVPGAEVVLVRGNDQRMFTTGAEGTLQISGLETGEWTMTVRRDGFIERQRPVVIQPVAATVSVSLDVAGLFWIFQCENCPQAFRS
jgi:hypothetical protein